MTSRADLVANFYAMGANPYPGRGIVIGMDDARMHVIQIYWIMGRSDNSRNRIFDCEGGRLFTEAADPAKVEDPSLIIYNAMGENLGHYVVSNGDQTDTILDAIRERPVTVGVLADSLRSAGRIYEPDPPNFTPRISGVSHIRNGEVITELSVLKKHPWLLEGSSCERQHYEYRYTAPGVGFCITTYDGDGDPLPSFTGDPIPMPIVGGIKNIAKSYWDMLNPDNLVSLAVKAINVDTGDSEIRIMNRFRKVEESSPT